MSRLRVDAQAALVAVAHPFVTRLPPPAYVVVNSTRPLAAAGVIHVTRVAPLLAGSPRQQPRWPACSFVRAQRLTPVGLRPKAAASSCALLNRSTGSRAMAFST